MPHFISRTSFLNLFNKNKTRTFLIRLATRYSITGYTATWYLIKNLAFFLVIWLLSLSNFEREGKTMDVYFRTFSNIIRTLKLLPKWEHAYIIKWMEKIYLSSIWFWIVDSLWILKNRKLFIILFFVEKFRFKNWLNCLSFTLFRCVFSVFTDKRICNKFFLIAKCDPKIAQLMQIKGCSNLVLKFVKSSKNFGVCDSSFFLWMI